MRKFGMSDWNWKNNNEPRKKDVRIQRSTKITERIAVERNGSRFYRRIESILIGLFPFEYFERQF
jgi:hypothetical protein